MPRTILLDKEGQPYAYIENDLKMYSMLEGNEDRCYGIAQCHHLRRAINVNPNKLPVGSVPIRRVGDTIVYVLSRKEAEFISKERGLNSTRPHRVFAVCNHCERDIPAGKFGQHLKIHSEVK